MVIYFLIDATIFLFIYVYFLFEQSTKKNFPLPFRCQTLISPIVGSHIGLGSGLTLDWSQQPLVFRWVDPIGLDTLMCGHCCTLFAMLVMCRLLDVNYWQPFCLINLQVKENDHVPCDHPPYLFHVLIEYTVFSTCMLLRKALSKDLGEKHLF